VTLSLYHFQGSIFSPIAPPKIPGLTSSLVFVQVPLLASGNWHPVSLLHVDGFSSFVDFPTDSGGPAVVDVPDVNNVPAVVGLYACC
jgi:hypothetical protein